MKELVSKNSHSSEKTIRGDRKQYVRERNGKGQFVPPNGSIERFGLSEDELAKEVAYQRCQTTKISTF